jgi:hypothetical protein
MVKGQVDNWAKWLGGETAKGQIGYGRNGEKIGRNGRNGIGRNGNTPFQEDHFKVKKNIIISARCERLQSVSTVKLVFTSTKNIYLIYSCFYQNEMDLMFVVGVQKKKKNSIGRPRLVASSNFEMTPKVTNEI